MQVAIPRSNTEKAAGRIRGIVRGFRCITTWLIVALQLGLLIMPTRAVFADELIVGQAITAPSTVAPSSEPLVATAPDVIMTAFSTGDRLDVVELYNQSPAAVWLGDMALMTRDSTNVTQTIPLKGGFLLSKHYITFAADTRLIRGALSLGAQQPTAGGIAEIRIRRGSSTTQVVNVPASTGNISAKDNYLWAQHKQRGNASLKQTGDFVTDFSRKSTALSVEGTELYVPSAVAPALHITEIHANPADCEPVAASVLNVACSDYVKIVNTSDTPINLTNYRLRIGVYGDSPTISNTFNWQQSVMTPEDEYLLNPHERLIVRLRDDLKPLALAATGKYVWIEDYFGTTTYEAVQYPDMTLAKYSGSSWAYDSGDHTWKAGIPSPGTTDNMFPRAEVPSIDVKPATELLPCAEGQYRSPETSRCRTILTTSLASCKEGQYRSEETNRCRSLVQAVAASLKPCSDDQFRNPLTGRCKKIASSEDIVQPCDAGWERNLETNRCRKVKVTSMPLAAFPVENIPPTSSHSAMMLGVAGVAAGALGYAGWEWRREVIAGARLMFRRLPFGK